MLSWLKGGEKVDHPLADAKDAKKLIDGLPKDPWKTLEDAGYWLGSLAETEAFKLDRRFELVSLLDVATRKAQERLLETYVTLPDTDRIQEKRTWKVLTDFWKHLGDAYLSCIDQAQDIKNVPGGVRPQLPLIAARATRALRHQMKWVLMRYGVVRPALWEEFARCVRMAEAAGAVDKLVALYPDAPDTSSQSYEFLRAMMFWAASPSGLSPVEQDVAERLVLQFTPKFRYDSKFWEGCDYCFDLSDGRPPLRLMRSTPVSDATRYFDVNEARPAVLALASLVGSTGQLPPGVGGPVADSVMVTRVLKHLGFNWAKEMPARAHERRRTALRLHVVHGYQNVLGAIEPSIGEGLDFSDTLSHDSWVAEDVSAGGYGVIVPAGKGEWLRVGVILALRGEMDATWSMGIIRRVKGDEHRQHRIGIQLISKSPVSVHLRSISGLEQGRKRQHAILLSARVSPSGSLHIVARRDLLSGREPIEAMYGKPAVTQVLEPGGALETGYDFDWIRYKLVEPLV